MYLIDTDALSAIRRRERQPSVSEWFSAQRSADLHLSVITIGEVERGIAQQIRVNPRFAEDLSSWLSRVIAWYQDRILPITLPIAQRWGQLTQEVGHRDPDLLIAATALEYGLTVVTRNVRHFEPTAVPVFNPFVDRETADD